MNSDMTSLTALGLMGKSNSKPIVMWIDTETGTASKFISLELGIDSTSENEPLF